MASSDEGKPALALTELSTTQPSSSTQGSISRPSGRSLANRKPLKCRYFGTKRGCRAGSSCTYVHDVSSPGPLTASSSQEEDRPLILTNAAPTQGTQGPNGRSRTVDKPVSDAERQNPREFQLNQIRRKFRPTETTDSSGTHLKFTMVPTDPDFSFDITGLDCVLHVPLQYPGRELPSLEVFNKNLDPNSRLLVQQRFDHIVKVQPASTLLRLMTLLDRELEHALTHPPADTAAGSTAVSEIQTGQVKPKGEGLPLSSGQEGEEKSSQRKGREITQLVSRLGRDPLFKANPDGVSFTVPISPLRGDLLPRILREVKTVLLIVPLTYPLDPCRIKISGIDDDCARSLEAAFQEHVAKNSDMSLTAHINYLAATMHRITSQPTGKTSVSEAVSSLPLRNVPPAPARAGSPAPQADSPLSPSEAGPSDTPLPDRPHVHVIPRPPEWENTGDSDEGDSDISDESWSEGSLSDTEEGGGVRLPDNSTYQTGKRVVLSFPNVELHGIELLALGSLSVTLKCERCKELSDVKNIKIGEDGISVPATRTEVCQKCSSYLRVGFRRDWMHPSSSRAGTLFLDGCTATDLLPSYFVPTCSECSTNYPSPGVSAVRGDQKLAICRECHNRMQFKLPELKFLLVSAGEGSSQGPGRAPRKPKESLGIVAGQELPRRGRCSHYGRSYRWFRFGCCSRVFPCDKCHDAATDHPNEHANRMICGFCSREQNYRPEDCGICHAMLVGKAATGFWEGGKGTRNKVLMSRKDPRKYKRRGGTATGSSQKK
ncbi:hypothetical protein VTO42DRAFT_8275 [Malbranchea cinnamomea]